MYNPIAISNFFVQEYGHENKITPMKLVKLVYIAHGWHLGFTGKTLLEENPEAWKYGPVIPTVYHYYKMFGSSSIPPENANYNCQELPNSIKLLLRKVWEVYGKFTAVQLSELTHMEGTPWYDTYYKDFYHSKQIPDNLVKDYYEKKISNNKAVKGV